MNGEKLLAGESRDQFAFWIDGNVNFCRGNTEVSPEITIQNGEIIQSACGDHPMLNSK